LHALLWINDPEALDNLEITVVSVFRDGEFTGTILLSLLPAGGDFDLYVGQDDSIKAERK
jgi:hypothetical protein